MSRLTAMMRKRAVLEGLGAAAAQLPLSVATILLGASAAGGAMAGAVGAKIFAHSKTDNENVKNGYMSERIDSDIEYLKAKLDEEYVKSRRAGGVKGARVLG